MTPRAPATPAVAGDRDDSAFQHALQSGDFAALHATPINRLIQEAAADIGRRGVVDELGALRIVLTRLVNEQDDLDRLTANVTRVASVALHAARTQRLIGESASELIGGALGLIIDEIQRDHDRHGAIDPGDPGERTMS